MEDDDLLIVSQNTHLLLPEWAWRYNLHDDQVRLEVHLEGHLEGQHGPQLRMQVEQL
jgi:hypothetical protein